uniref:Uncharacterized protein n=1 Tax=Rhipicephalus zambeziensis TaxID=60191 RepID=A0A224YAQ6_9ACAR
MRSQLRPRNLISVGSAHVTHVLVTTCSSLHGCTIDSSTRKCVRLRRHHVVRKSMRLAPHGFSARSNVWERASWYSILKTAQR